MRVAALALPILLAHPAFALWPFKQKRFEAEAFINAGDLGVVDGRVAAVGDWNGDQLLDVFVLDDERRTITLQVWDRDTFKFKTTSTLTQENKIRNIVPGDFDRDGHLDLLVMYEDQDGGWWGDKEARTGMTLYFGTGYGLRKDRWDLEKATEAQPIVFDADGSLRLSLLGYSPTESGSVLRSWLNEGGSLTLQNTPLTSPDQACQLADQHSSAFIDIDGDCLPDLVLHCQAPKSAQQSVQIWLNKGESGFVLSKSYDLPKGSGPLTFADMDRDGTMDMIFPTCSHRSKSEGTGSDCSINIAYNRQVSVCSGLNSETNNNGAVDSELKCRGYEQLCTADPKFEFDFDNLATTPLSSIFGSSNPDLLLHLPNNPSVQLPIRPGDYNVDGYPDLLFVISNATAKDGGIFGGGTGTQVRLVENVACGKNIAGCEDGRKRGWKVPGGKGWEVLDQLVDVTGASWIDIDDDGSLDMLVQRSGDQGEGKVTFIQNNFFHDAFFLKAQVLNGACDGDCIPSDGTKKYKSLGVSYSGATFKFTVLDTLGRRVAQQAAQLPQTGYHALETPYSFIGLGRTNNYVERLSIGASLYPEHMTEIESIVPNSQIIVNPPSPDTRTNGTTPPGLPIKFRPTTWRSELYLKPGDWVPWVGAAVAGTVIVLATVVLVLNEREKREDERERQRALHAINFQAL